MLHLKFQRKNQRGFGLIEVLIATALLSIIGVVLVGAIGNASKVLFLTNEKQTARNIAEMQLEQIKSQGWSVSYSKMPEIAANYPGYDAQIQTSFPRSPDTNIQRIEITILHNNNPVFTLVSYKELKRT